MMDATNPTEVHTATTILVPQNLRNHRVNKGEVRHYVSPTVSPKHATPKKRVRHNRRNSLPNIGAPPMLDMESRWMSSSTHEHPSAASASLNSSGHDSSAAATHDEVPKSPRPLGDRGGESERDMQGSRHGKRRTSGAWRSPQQQHRRSSLRPSRENSKESTSREGGRIVEEASDDQSIDLEDSQPAEGAAPAAAASGNDSMLFGNDSYVGFMPLEGSSSSQNVPRCNSSLTMSGFSLNYSDSNLNMSSAPKQNFQSVVRHQKRRRSKKTGALLISPTASSSNMNNNSIKDSSVSSSLSSISANVVRDGSISESSGSNHSDPLTLQPPPPPPPPPSRWTASSPRRAELPPAFRGLASPTQARRSPSNDSVPVLPGSDDEVEGRKQHTGEEDSYVVDDRLPPAFQNMARVEHRRKKEPKAAATFPEEDKSTEPLTAAEAQVQDSNDGEDDCSFADDDDKDLPEPAPPLDSGLPPAFQAAFTSPTTRRRKEAAPATSTTISKSDEGKTEAEANEEMLGERSPLPAVRRESQGQPLKQEPIPSAPENVDATKADKANEIDNEKEVEELTSRRASSSTNTTTSATTGSTERPVRERRQSRGRPPKQEPFYFAPENLDEIQAAVAGITRPDESNDGKGEKEEEELPSRRASSSINTPASAIAGATDRPVRERRQSRGPPPKQEPFYFAPENMDEIQAVVAGATKPDELNDGKDEKEEEELPSRRASATTNTAASATAGAAERPVRERRQSRGPPPKQEPFYFAPENMDAIQAAVAVDTKKDIELAEQESSAPSMEMPDRPRSRSPRPGTLDVLDSSINKLNVDEGVGAAKEPSAVDRSGAKTKSKEMSDRKRRGRSPRRGIPYASNSVDQTQAPAKASAKDSEKPSMEMPNRRPRGRSPRHEPFHGTPLSIEQIHVPSQGQKAAKTAGAYTESPSSAGAVGDKVWKDCLAGNSSSRDPPSKAEVARSRQAKIAVRGPNTTNSISTREESAGVGEMSLKEPVISPKKHRPRRRSTGALAKKWEELYPSTQPVLPSSAPATPQGRRRQVSVGRRGSLGLFHNPEPVADPQPTRQGSQEDKYDEFLLSGSKADFATWLKQQEETTETATIETSEEPMVRRGSTGALAEKWAEELLPRIKPNGESPSPKMESNRKRADSWGYLQERPVGLLRPTESTSQETHGSNGTAENNVIFNSERKSLKEPTRRRSTGAMINRWEKLMKSKKPTVCESSSEPEPKQERRGSTGNMTEIVKKKRESRKERKEKQVKKKRNDDNKKKKKKAIGAKTKEASADLLDEPPNASEEPSGQSHLGRASDFEKRVPSIHQQASGEASAEGSTSDAQATSKKPKSKKKPKKKGIDSPKPKKKVLGNSKKTRSSGSDVSFDNESPKTRQRTLASSKRAVEGDEIPSGSIRSMTSPIKYKKKRASSAGRLKEKLPEPLVAAEDIKQLKRRSKSVEGEKSKAKRRARSKSRGRVAKDKAEKEVKKKKTHSAKV